MARFAPIAEHLEHRFSIYLGGVVEGVFRLVDRHGGLLARLCSESGDAVELVAAFVVADLAQDVGDGDGMSPTVGEGPVEGLVFGVGVGCDEAHVLAFSVVLKGGIERVAPGWRAEVEDPGGEVPGTGEQPRDDAKPEPGEAMAASGEDVLEDQHVPLLVVVGGAGVGDACLDPSGHGGLPAGAGDAALSDTFPRAVGDLGEVLENQKLL